jgi:putative oxidoreductase
MKIASTIARYLLGALFTFAGLNGFFHFLPGAPPPGPGANFVLAMTATGYQYVIFVCQLIPGLLLLINRYVPLALCILGPVIVNIFFFHVFMVPQGLALAAVVVILWVLVALRNKQHLAGILAQRTE